MQTNKKLNDKSKKHL